MMAPLTERSLPGQADLVPGVPDGVDATDDAFLGSTLRIWQPRHGYRAGLDAVFLAACVEVELDAKVRVLDVGAGVGVIGLAVAARLPRSSVVLIEKQDVLCDLATANIRRNNLEARVHARQLDVLAGNANSEYGGHGQFDVVICNPPFYEAGKVRSSADSLKAQSHAMPDGGLAGWIDFLGRNCRPGGTALMVHRAEALGDLLGAFRGQFGGLLIQPLHPRPGAAASRVIVRGTRGSRAPMRILPGLILHGPAHGFRPEVDRMLRNPVGWSLEGFHAGGSAVE